MIEIKEIKYFFDYVDDMKRNLKFYDVHVHPFDVLYDDHIYKKIDDNGLYCSNNLEYKKQEYYPVKIEQETDELSNGKTGKIFEKMIIMKVNKIYAHAGPKVLDDVMKMSRIDNVFLLPVAGYIDTNNNRIENIKGIFGFNEKYVIGYSIENKLSNDYIEKDIRNNILLHDIKVIKIHPNITGINIGRQDGIERIEKILIAANMHKMIVVIHGGKSNINKYSNMSEYSVMKNLRKINWNLTRYPIIISHAGIYGYNKQDDCNENMALVEDLMEKNDNIYVDIAGLGIKMLKELFARLNNEKVLFGSDSFYYEQWREVLKLFYILKEKHHNYESYFVRVMNKNPSKLLSCY